MDNKYLFDKWLISDMDDDFKKEYNEFSKMVADTVTFEGFAYTNYISKQRNRYDMNRKEYMRIQEELGYGR